MAALDKRVPHGSRHAAACGGQAERVHVGGAQFTLDSEGLPFPLDMRGELDDTATFKSGKKWGDLSFPQPFGRTMSKAEETVHEADEKTGRRRTSVPRVDHLQWSRPRPASAAGCPDICRPRQ